MADRGGEQAAVGADLDQGVAAGGLRVEFEPVGAGVGGVEQAQPVADAVDVQPGPGGAVDQDDVAEHAVGVGVGDTGTGERGVDGGVPEGAVGGEGAVGDHQRQVALAARQRQRALLVVVDEVEAGQSTPDARAGEAHSVVVVPEGGGALLARIGVAALADDVAARRVAHPRHARHAGCPLVGVRRRSHRQQHVDRVAVAVRRGVPAVQVGHGRHRQLVAVLDHGRPPETGDHGRPWEAPAVRPGLGLHPGQDLQPGDLLGDLVVVGGPVGAHGLQQGRHRQWDPEGLGQVEFAGQQPSGTALGEQPGRRGNGDGGQRARTEDGATDAQEPAPVHLDTFNGPPGRGSRPLPSGPASYRSERAGSGSRQAPARPNRTPLTSSTPRVTCTPSDRA